MDTSKEYIEMCKAAKEIQGMFRNIKYAVINSGHFVAYLEDAADTRYKVELLEHWIDLDRVNWCLFRPGKAQYGSHTPEHYKKLNVEFWWLPRQDQLQEILSETCTLGYFIAGLHEFFDPESLCPDADGEYPACERCQKAGTDRRSIFKTMEQWWLAFVMEELYTKTWNGVEWVFDSSWRVPDHVKEGALVSIVKQ